jgi:DNA-binding NtrC family response regulator
MSRGDVIVLPSASLRGKERPPAAAPDPRPLAERLSDFKRERIREALDHAGQSQTRAAERLGLHRQSLSRMMRELGLRAADPERVSGP